MWNPHLVDVCTGFRGYRFDNPHISLDESTDSIDLRQSGTILPAPPERRVSHAISPSRVEAHGIGVGTGYLSASSEAI